MNVKLTDLFSFSGFFVLVVGLSVWQSRRVKGHGYTMPEFLEYRYNAAALKTARKKTKESSERIMGALWLWLIGNQESGNKHEHSIK